MIQMTNILLSLGKERLVQMMLTEVAMKMGYPIDEPMKRAIEKRNSYYEGINDKNWRVV